MNSLTTIDNHLFTIIFFMIFAVVFHLLSMRLRKFILTKTKESIRIKYYDSLLMIFWLVYASYLYMRYSVVDERLFWLVFIFFILIFLFFFWFILREIIAGISTRVSYKIKKGQTIQFNEIQGKIQALNFTSLELLKQNGNVYLIPWSKIVNQSLEIVSINESKNMFERRIQIEKNLSFDELKKKLLYEIIIFPGTIASKKPIITLLDNTTVYDISLTLFTIDKTHFDELIDHLESLEL